MRARVVVVGGGVMGTSIALHLAQRLHPIDQPVVLLERREIGAGSSGRSGAILRQYYADPQLATMARDSLRVWSSFLVNHGYQVGFHRTGVLTLVGPGQRELQERLRANVETLRGVGIDIEVIDAAGVRRLAPGLEAPEGTLAAYEPAGGFVDPRRALDTFAALARYHGATTRLGTEARGFVLRDGRVRGVLTDEGEVECEQVVVAAGPWTRRLLAEVGVDLPLRVVRPEQHFLGMPALPRGVRPGGESDQELPSSPLMDTALRPASANEEPALASHPVLLDLEHGYYARCQPDDDCTRVGAIDYAECDELDDPDQLDEEVAPAFGRWARAALEARVPAYRDERDVGALAAWYTLSPDAQPMIGPLPGIEGLFVVAGFSGHGFKLAPAVGEGVARMVLGSPPGTFDAEFFDPTRFRRAAPSAAAGGAFGM